jgi:signal transduction histidine kinase
LEERPGELNATQRRFLQIAYRSSERLSKLVEELLTVSRINRGTLKLVKIPFRPGHLLRAAVDMLDSVASERSIALIVDDSWPADEVVIGDEDRLEQVLSNLLSNAIKFSADGSAVFVRSEWADGQWRVEVEDSGIGIPNDELGRLFQRFYRASNAIEAQIQGTGLGLYLCKAIVEEHGGQIGISSQPGVGTTVWFTVPAGVQPAGPDSREAATAGVGTEAG